MRHLKSTEIEHDETRALPERFAKHYAPNAAVTLGDPDVVVAASNTDRVVLDGETLFIEPDTVSWSFLTKAEAAMFDSLRGGRTLRAIESDWPSHALGPANGFIGDLFRRGLVSLNGQSSVADDIFHDSPNVEEGHLVEILLSEKCNLACGYCLAGAAQNMPHMDDDIARLTVDRAFRMRDADTITFEYSGGEPFLRFDLMRELTEYARAHPERNGRSVHFTIQTNATLLNEERVDWLVENNVILGVSLDGDPSMHDRSRPQVNGGESLSKVLRGLDLLQSRAVPFGALVVLNRANAGSVRALVDFLRDNGITGFKLNPIAFLGDARGNWDEFSLTQEEIIAYFKELAEMLVRERLPMAEANLADMVRHTVSKARASRCLRGHCKAGETFQAIAADGTIFPCGRATQSPGLALGNVADASSGLDTPAQTNLHMQQLKERRPKTLEDCVTCSYRELCQSGCSVQAWEKYGTVRSKTPECAFFKTMYPYLMRWLSFDDDAVDHFNRAMNFGRPERLEIAGRTYLH